MLIADLDYQMSTKIFSGNQNFRCAMCGEQGSFGAQYSTQTACTRLRIFSPPCPPCITLEALDRQIAETRAFLAHMEAHRATVLPDINASHDPLTDLLPTEIASRIFVSCMYDLEEGEELDHHVPLTLSSVSRRWRDIARSTAPLWAYVRVGLDSVGNQQEYQEILHQWLSRSRGFPLSVVVHVKYCDPNDTKKWAFCRTIIRILNAHSSRWTDLCVIMPLHLITILDGRAPNLRQLSITPPYSLEDYSGPAYFCVSIPYPAPNTVFLTQCRLENFKIEWQNVTKVTLSAILINECLEVFKMAPLLQECALYDVEESPVVVSYPETPIILEHLTTMDVEVTTSSTSLFFDNIVAPSLNSLFYRGDKQSLNPLTSLVRRSSCQIKSLTVYEFDPVEHEAELCELLWALPALESLGLSSIYLSNEIFELLSRSAQVPGEEGQKETQFLPLLRKLRIRVPAGPPRFSWSAVRSTIQTQLFLERFHLDVRVDKGDKGCYIDEASLDFFQRLVDGGFHMSIWNERWVGSHDVIAYSRDYYAGRKMPLTITGA
ncbi:unnamed protein product [Cyclocybe aegerita]|uniref:F-box domain-containing protein n=1 Tax=Cyclocybe aegerita TaxID=1973307 RepID=A0A8S0XQT1_CYCAE|nr:unnamed protein product [Cyclocybe aegerita]